MSVSYLAVQAVNHQTYLVSTLLGRMVLPYAPVPFRRISVPSQYYWLYQNPQKNQIVLLGIFIIWILYLPSSHGLPANNFQPALQIELLGSRTVGPGTAESTHSAWTETAACSLPSSWLWSQNLLSGGPPQPAEISFLLHASCNNLDLFSRIKSVSYSCLLNAIVS